MDMIEGSYRLSFSILHTFNKLFILISVNGFLSEGKGEERRGEERRNKTNEH